MTRRTGSIALSAAPQQIRPPEPDQLAEVELARDYWAEIEGLTSSLTGNERLAPGYFTDPTWNVKDLIAHLGAWFTEAHVMLVDMAAHAYVPHDFDVERRNSATLDGLRDEPWEAVWSRATAAQAWMVEAWLALRQPDDEAVAWVRKAGAEHCGEHLPRLRAWVAELLLLRTQPRRDERDP